MTPSFVVVVDAAPAPQGSKRHVGGGVLIESSRNVKPFREAIARAATEEALKRGPGASSPVFSGPVTVSLGFTLPRPAGHFRRRTKDGVKTLVLREDAPPYPAKRPDLDKLTRAVLDALTTAVVYPDDGLVVQLEAEKNYPGGSLDALDGPGVVIVVTDAP
jgi:Holliday junction resolvase RusA-like endonuclease